MSTIPMIPFEAGEAVLDWIGLTDALAAGHQLPKAEIGDTFLYRGDDTLLSRAAWIDGLGIAVKSATVFPGNPAKGAPMINGGLNLYNEERSLLQAPPPQRQIMLKRRTVCCLRRASSVPG